MSNQNTNLTLKNDRGYSQKDINAAATFFITHMNRIFILVIQELNYY